MIIIMQTCKTQGLFFFLLLAEHSTLPQEICLSDFCILLLSYLKVTSGTGHLTPL